MQDGGEDILGRDGALGGVGGNLVGLSDDVAPGDAAAGEDDGVAARPVVTAAAAAGGDLRRPAVLADADDQRLVEKATGFEVDEQAREGAVEPGEEFVLHTGEVIPVGVPPGAGEAVLVPEDRDEPAAGLDEPACGEAGLAEEGHAVEVAGPVGFEAEVERPAELLRSQEVVGHRTVAVDAGDLGLRVDLPAQVFELLEHRTAIVHPIDRQARPAIGDGRELEPAVAGDAAVGLEVVPDLVGEGLLGLLRPLADELGANGVIELAEEAAVRARAGNLADALAGERPGQRQVARDLALLGVAGLRRVQPIHIFDDRADVRPVIRVPGIQLHREQDLGDARGGKRDAVDGVLVGHRPEDRHLVHHAREQRQALRDPQARHIRVDRAADFAPDALGRVGLGVEGFELTRRAIEVQEDAGLRLAEPAGGLRRRLRRRNRLRDQGIRPEAHQSERTDLEQVAPGDPVAEPLGIAEDPQHRDRPLDLELLHSLYSMQDLRTVQQQIGPGRRPRVSVSKVGGKSDTPEDADPRPRNP